MEAFEWIAENMYLLKIPFGPIWTGVVLLRGRENILVDSSATTQDSGLLGAGAAQIPIACFEKAMAAFAEAYQQKTDSAFCRICNTMIFTARRFYGTAQDSCRWLS